MNAKLRGTSKLRLLAACLTDQGRVRAENQDDCATDVKRGQAKRRAKGKEVVLRHLVPCPSSAKVKVQAKVEESKVGGSFLDSKVLASAAGPVIIQK